MAKLAIFNPKNFQAESKSKFGFQEGYIRVDESVFKVHQADAREGFTQRDAVTALAWKVTRLDENLDALTNEEGEEITENLVFSLGGKSLIKIHPGSADGPEDDEAEDLGTEVNVEGPTVYLVDSNFRLHKHSGAAILMESLKISGFLEEYIDRVWAPDYIGSVFHMKTFNNEEVMMKYTNKHGKEEERATAYKVVDRVVRAGYEKKAATKAVGGSAKGNEALDALTPILQKIATDRDGSTMTRKALVTNITSQLQQQKVDAKLHIGILSLVKDDKFLTKNAAEFGYTYDAAEGTVSFGEAA
jgi:hypothetical protein